MISVVIIEDEPIAAKYLAKLLCATGRVEIAGEAPDAEGGLRLCAQLRPEAVFMDIRLPSQDGISLAQRLHLLPQPPLVVFTTGYADRASDAFRVAAVDYLIKPLNAAQVAEAVARLEVRKVMERICREKRMAASAREGEAVDEDLLPVKVAGEDVVRFLTRREVVAAVRRDRRTWIHTVREEIPTYFAISDVLRWLGGAPFLQVSRETLVNMQAVESVVHYGDRLYQLQLRDRSGSTVEVSRSGANRLSAYLKLRREAVDAPA
ncbi:DNA-binding response regulator [Capsulimonas corticalis]|uniref:DNA-binding response regulator n=1 Tax=Capsulimonas corticalis TaxID=2219043 RepID=A0A402D3I7_9BACT|nr:LytTR family DNA-binding domain-containing protein [Capsulimonas corticalis]BDI28549.1 DNA-binding response regulator [Capsulimonas corticalis]